MQHSFAIANKLAKNNTMLNLLFVCFYVISKYDFFSIFTAVYQTDVAMNNLLSLLRNKYFISTLAFVVWMLFFDRNDVLSQYEYQNQVNSLQQQKDFLVTQTKVVKQSLRELDNNLNTAEKFAREKYFMKKENEDVFVVIKKDTQP